MCIEAIGPRANCIARCVAMDDQAIDSGWTTGEPATLKLYLAPVASFVATPAVDCFGLLEYFDLPQLAALSGAPPN